MSAGVSPSGQHSLRAHSSPSPDENTTRTRPIMQLPRPSACAAMQTFSAAMPALMSRALGADMSMAAGAPCSTR